MSDALAWIIVAAFYAPLHFLLPALVLFITGDETERVRRRLIRQGLVDSAVSMLVAFAAAIPLAQHGRMFAAMLLLLLSMLYPFVGIWRRRRAWLPAARDKSGQ